MGMKLRGLHWLAAFCIWVGWSSCPGWLYAQQDLQFTGIRSQTNKEIVLTLKVPAAGKYRIDTTTNLDFWHGLVTLASSATVALQHTDSATPFLASSFYRAQQVAATNMAGDHLQTADGEVIIQPRYHASFVMSWKNTTIYVDPAPPATFTGLPKADLVLVTHAHGDHFNTSTIDQIRATNAAIIVSQDVYDKLTSTEKILAKVLGYGATTNVLGIEIEAVPAYNGNHPFGLGNGYVLTIGGKHLYISGDT